MHHDLDSADFWSLGIHGCSFPLKSHKQPAGRPSQLVLVKALNSKDSPVEWKSLALTGGRESKSMRADWVMVMIISWLGDWIGLGWGRWVKVNAGFILESAQLSQSGYVADGSFHPKVTVITNLTSY